MGKGLTSKKCCRECVTENVLFEPWPEGGVEVACAFPGQEYSRQKEQEGHRS